MVWSRQYQEAVVDHYRRTCTTCFRPKPGHPLTIAEQEAPLPDNICTTCQKPIAVPWRPAPEAAEKGAGFVGACTTCGMKRPGAVPTTLGPRGRVGDVTSELLPANEALALALSTNQNANGNLDDASAMLSYRQGAVQAAAAADLAAGVAELHATKNPASRPAADQSASSATATSQASLDAANAPDRQSTQNFAWNAYNNAQRAISSAASAITADQPAPAPGPTPAPGPMPAPAPGPTPPPPPATSTTDYTPWIAGALAAAAVLGVAVVAVRAKMPPAHVVAR